MMHSPDNDVLPETEEARRERALAAIDAMTEIGDAVEQQETFTYLKTALDEDRLSDRKLFNLQTRLEPNGQS